MGDREEACGFPSRPLKRSHKPRPSIAAEPPDHILDPQARIARGAADPASGGSSIPASLGLPGQTAESQPPAPAAPMVLTTVSGGFILTSPAIGGAVTHPVFRNAAALLAVEGLWATGLGSWGGGQKVRWRPFSSQVHRCVCHPVNFREAAEPTVGASSKSFFLYAAFTLLHSQAKSLLGNGCGDPLSACLSHH